MAILRCVSVDFTVQKESGKESGRLSDLHWLSETSFHHIAPRLTLSIFLLGVWTTAPKRSEAVVRAQISPNVKLAPLYQQTRGFWLTYVDMIHDGFNQEKW